MSTLEVNKITPQGTGTTVTLGDSGDSIDITSGATVTNFKSTGIDDNATSTAVTINSSEQTTLTTSSDTPLILDGSHGTDCGIKMFGGISANTFSRIRESAGQLLLEADPNSDSGGSAIRFRVDNTERMRIDSNGKVSVGDTIPYSGGSVNGVQLHSGPPIACSRDSTAGRTQVQFDNPNGTVGSISTSGSSTAYNTSSDYRLKENVIDLADATTRIKQLQPKRFNFIADADTTVDGFLAHEVSDIVPEAITGTKDEVDADGNPKYQGIDQSKLVPLLTASLQEAIAKIETLESTVSDLTTRLEALENA